MKVYVACYSDWDGYEPIAVLADKKSAQEYCDSDFTRADDVIEVEFYDKDNHEWFDKEIF